MPSITASTDTAGTAAPYVLRPLQAGDIGWVIRSQGLYYAREFGFDQSFEVLVDEIAIGFAKNFDPRRERAWIAERREEIVGSVFLMCETDELARLRLLYVEPQARGWSTKASVLRAPQAISGSRCGPMPSCSPHGASTKRQVSSSSPKSAARSSAPNSTGRPG